MIKIFNLKQQKQIRRNLRKQPIVAENMLWNRLRNKQQEFKFRRQFGIGKYIVDFYCPKAKLVIEIDGATHETKKELVHDNIRQQYLEQLGLTVKRYTNTDVHLEMSAVLTDIYEICNNLTSPRPSPCEGEGGAANFPSP